MGKIVTRADLRLYLEENIPDLLPMLEHHTDEDLWKLREGARSRTDEYKRVGFDGFPNIDGHYLHVSLENPKLVAYTSDEDKARRDIQLRVKPGKYLRKHFPHATDEQIEHAVAKFAVNEGQVVGFTITNDPDEIEDIYTENTNITSCMDGRGYTTKGWTSGYHPTRVYGGPDTAVAYLRNEHGTVVSRAVVNQKDRTWLKVYGDYSRMKNFLTRYDYSRGDLEGCRLLRIEDPRGEILCPYVDGADAIELDMDYLVVDSEYGEHSANSEMGFLIKRRVATCECCDDDIRSDDDIFRVDNADLIMCETCFDENVSSVYTVDGQEPWYCPWDDSDVVEYDGEHYHIDALCYHDLVIVEDGGVYHESDTVFCYFTEERIAEDEAVRFAHFDDGEVMYFAKDSFVYKNLRNLYLSLDNGRILYSENHDWEELYEEFDLAVVPITALADGVLQSVIPDSISELSYYKILQYFHLHTPGVNYNTRQFLTTVTTNLCRRRLQGTTYEIFD